MNTLAKATMFCSFSVVLTASIASAMDALPTGFEKGTAFSDPLVLQDSKPQSPFISKVPEDIWRLVLEELGAKDSTSLDEVSSYFHSFRETMWRQWAKKFGGIPFEGQTDPEFVKSSENRMSVYAHLMKANYCSHSDEKERLLARADRCVQDAIALGDLNALVYQINKMYLGTDANTQSRQEALRIMNEALQDPRRPNPGWIVNLQLIKDSEHLFNNLAYIFRENHFPELHDRIEFFVGEGDLKATLLKALGLWHGRFGYGENQELAQSIALNLEADGNFVAQLFRVKFDPIFIRVATASERVNLRDVLNADPEAQAWLTSRSEKDSLIKEYLEMMADTRLEYSRW